MNIYTKIYTKIKSLIDSDFISIFNATSAKSAEAAASAVSALASKNAIPVSSQVYATDAAGRATVADGFTYLIQATGENISELRRRTNSTTSNSLGFFQKAQPILDQITETTTAVSFGSGVANEGAQTITIPNGQSGLDSSLIRTQILTNYPKIVVGSIIRYTILVTESASGITATKMVAALTVVRSGSTLTSQHTSRSYEIVDSVTVRWIMDYTVQVGDTELRPNIRVYGPANASGVSMVFTLKDMYVNILNPNPDTNSLTEKFVSQTALIHTFDGTLTVANIEEGVDIFVNSGYINKNTGLPVVDASYKYSKFVPIKDSKNFSATNLSIAGAFRQVSFFSGTSYATYLSSYTADDNSLLELTPTNVPAGARYMIFNTAVSKTPSLAYAKKKYKAIAPVDINSGHWTSINATTGYSAFYGRYWNGSGWTDSNDFSGHIYPVVAGTIIHVVGNFYGGSIPIVAFFSNIGLTTHIANGAQNGTSSNAYYDFTLTVPASATYALVQQSRRLDLAQPFTELVSETLDTIEKRKIILVGDSFTQMGGYADYLAKLIKAVAPEFDIFNYGIGGEKTWEISGRLGAMKMILNPGNTYTTADGNNGKRYFEIPSTTSTVALGPAPIKSGWDNSSALALLLQNTPTKDCEPKYVMVNGIQCLLTYSAPNYFLNRVIAGVVVHRVYVGSELIVYNLPKITSKDIVIPCFGQNGGFATSQELIDQYKEFTENIGTDRLVILSSHYAQTSNNAIMSYTTNRDTQEALLMKEYGSKYINMREYFCGRAYIDALANGWWNANNYPTDIGIEAHPDAADILEMTNGRYAPMFWPNPNNGADIIHMSRRTYQIYYQKIFQRILDLKYL